MLVFFTVLEAGARAPYETRVPVLHDAAVLDEAKAAWEAVAARIGRKLAGLAVEGGGPGKGWEHWSPDTLWERVAQRDRRCPWGWSVETSLPVPGGAWVACVGAGAVSRTAAEESALAQLQATEAALRRTQSPYRARANVHQFCGSCAVTGVAPGLRRQVCPACRGTGRVNTVVLPAKEAT